MTNATSVKAHEFPAVKQSEYKTALTDLSKAQQLEGAQESVAAYEKTVSEGSAVKQKLQALHLEVKGQFGDSAVDSAIRSLREELVYQARYLQGAKDLLARHQGDAPADDDSEF